MLLCELCISDELCSKAPGLTEEWMGAGSGRAAAMWGSSCCHLCSRATHLPCFCKEEPALIIIILLWGITSKYFHCDKKHHVRLLLQLVLYIENRRCGCDSLPCFSAWLWSCLCYCPGAHWWLFLPCACLSPLHSELCLCGCECQQYNQVRIRKRIWELWWVTLSIEREVLQHSVCQLCPFYPNAFKIRTFKLENSNVKQCPFVFLIISDAKEMTLSNTNPSMGRRVFPWYIKTVDKT